MDRAAPTIGVLALQGAFDAHRQRLTDLGIHAPLVRTGADLAGVDALVLPGGESTTMSKLLTSSGLFDELKARLSDGFGVFGTCAGLILLASDIEGGRSDQRSFGALDLTVRRNGYGRQVDSFEADLDLEIDRSDVGGGRGDGAADPFHAVFIRAPVITATGPGVTVLARLGDDPVLVSQGGILAAAFHPELTRDDRIHRTFVDCVVARGDHLKE